MNEYSTGIKNNRYIYLSIYFFSNLYFVFIYSLTGKLGGDFSDKYSSSIIDLIISFVLIFTVWFLFYLYFCFLCRIKIDSIKIHKSGVVHWIIFILATIHIYGLFNGYISPSSDIKHSLFYLLFNYIFTVDTLLLIYLFYFINNKNKIYIVNLILTIIIYLYSGRTGIFIFILALINFHYLYKTGKVKVKINLLLISISFLVFPFIRSYKHYALLTVISKKYSDMSFFDGYIYFWSEKGFLNTYSIYFNETLERFQHVSNVSFVIEHYNKINNYLSNFDFVFIYSTTLRILEKALGMHISDYQFNKLLGSYISNGETFSWNVPVGVPGLIFINDVSFVLYALLAIVLLSFSVYLSKKIQDKGFVLELTFLSMLLYILHGWINDYISYCFSLVVFIFLLLVCEKLPSKIKGKYQ